MASVELSFGRQDVSLECTSLTGEERLGAVARFKLSAFAQESVSESAVVGQPCAILLQAQHGRRAIYGVVTELVAVMTSQGEKGRKYRLTVSSGLAVLELRRRTRVYQHLTVPAIIAQVLQSGGYRADDIELSLKDRHAPRRYVAQYDESDASFVRRLCEEEGLYFRFEPGDGRERFVLEDSSPNAPPAMEGALALVNASELHAGRLAAWNCRAHGQRRPGRVTLRDYDHAKPALPLEGRASVGTSTEQAIEVYAAPGRFSSADEGQRRATLHLESLRASADTITFQTNAVALAPGRSFDMAIATDYRATARPEGTYFATRLAHAWTAESDRYELTVDAIPSSVPFRLPRATPRPRAPGVHSAIVTGSPGEEIHPDDAGRVFVRFLWDREGPTDHKSSLPVRVMQPNTPGSMLLPRVGWEVFVAFEDGDPDRPYILGRAYNAKQPPPVSLPKNKTMTSLATYSSPGGGGQNAITFDDGAGRQHFAITAASGKHTTVAANAVVQTAKVDNQSVGGSQTRSVAANEDVSVGQAYLASMASQSASVGGSQSIFVKGNFGVSVGSETVLIGGALMEQVGNPVAGAANLAKAAALSGAGALGKAGAFLAAGAGLAMGAVEGYKHGGVKGAAKGLGMGALGMAAGMVPGGDAVMASVQGAASPAPWHDKKGPAGAQEAGGGAGGAASDASGAGGPGPGHRNQAVKGSMLELIGALHGVMTPGSIGWKTTGASTFLVGGGHSTKTANAGFKTLGVSSETLGALHVKAGADITRVVTGALNTTIGGSLKSTSGGSYNLKVNGALLFKVGGSLTLTGANVTFVCGGSKVSASPGGVLVESGNITITGASKQSAKTTHK